MTANTKRLFLFLLLLFAFIPDAFVQVRAGTIVRPRVIATEDSIIYEEETVDERHLALLRSLSGNWQLVSQKRQQNLPAEKLEGYLLRIGTDSTIGGQTPCRSIEGKFLLKGTRIRFMPAHTAKRPCAKEAEEVMFLNLLAQAITGFNIEGKTLYLRNGNGVVVFEAERK